MKADPFAMQAGRIAVFEAADAAAFLHPEKTGVVKTARLLIFVLDKLLTAGNLFALIVSAVQLFVVS